MQLNGEKFECLRYGNKQYLQKTYHYLSSSEKIITEKDYVKDLGVLMSNTGKFREHIDNTITQAKTQSLWILRAFHTREANLMISLWKSLVQSRLEYCSQLWCPLQKGDIKKIEETQRCFVPMTSISLS